MAENWISVDEEGNLSDETYCIKCDKDLMGEKVSGICPQCATPVAIALAGEPACFADSEGIIQEHVLCTECKSDLFNIAVEGECETCQTPCTHSLSQNLLRYADPKWVQTVRSGFLWYVIMAFVAMFIGIGSGFVFLVIKDRAIAYGISTGVGIVTAILVFLTTWFVTSPAPTDINRSRSNMARFMAGLTIFGAFLSATMVIRPDLGTWPALPGMLIQLGFAYAFYSYLSQLALRIPNEKLNHHVRIVLIGMVVCISLLFIGSLIAALSGVDPLAMQQAQQQASQTGQPMVIQGSMPMFMVGSLITGCLGGLPLLVFGIWGIVIMFMFRSRLSACIRLHPVAE